MPPASPTQSIDWASASEDAPTRTTMSDSSRKIAFLPTLARIESLPVIVAPRSTHPGDFTAWEGPRAVHAVDWIPAVPPSWDPRGPVRPVTLRRHLSMALPLSESLHNQRIRFAASFQILLVAVL